jgi:hypothetical protein
MRATVPNSEIVVALMRREIDRFVQAARVRSESQVENLRRANQRYHRSWPLLVAALGGTEDVSAALHNASTGGVGFLCDCEFPVGGTVLIKLFWHESSSLRVPAVVRHTTPHKGVMLVGCEFALDDEEACQAGLKTERWYT